MNAVLGPAYAASWSHDVVLPSLGDTVEGCFDRGEDTVVVWRAVCDVVDVPSMLR